MDVACRGSILIASACVNFNKTPENFHGAVKVSTSQKQQMPPVR